MFRPKWQAVQLFINKSSPFSTFVFEFFKNRFSSKSSAELSNDEYTRNLKELFSKASLHCVVFSSLVFIPFVDEIARNSKGEENKPNQKENMKKKKLIIKKKKHI